MPINELSPSYWDKFIHEYVKMMAQQHEIVTERISEAIPTLYLRYEDLLVRPEETLKEMYSFMLGVRSIEGTLIESRIENLCAEMFSDIQINAEQLNDTIKMYNKEQLEFIKEELRDFLYFFNYTDHPLESDPNTSFFTYNDVGHDQDKLISLFNGYLVKNEQSLQNSHCSLQSFDFDENDIGALPQPITTVGYVTDLLTVEIE